MDIKNLLLNAKNKRGKLQIYIDFYKYLPKQGSPEWLNNKKGDMLKPPTVGGSELKKLVDNPRSLAEDKLMPKNFTGNIHTRWGNIFEEVLSSIYNLILNTSSEELGSIPGFRDNNGDIIQSYSPDKIMVVDKNDLKNLFFSEFNDSIKSYDEEFLDFYEKADDELIVLTEFKCPTVRIPDGRIPDDYSLQTMAGSCTIPIIDISLFSNVSFRKCKIEDFADDNLYDINFHYKDVEADIDFNDPLFMGMLAIYNIDKDIKITKNIEDYENNQEIEDKILGYIKDEINKQGSEYYGIEYNIANILLLVKICHKFSKYIYNHNNLHIIIKSLLNRLLNIKDYEKIIDNLISYIIDENNSKNIDHGQDLGSFNSSELNKIFEKVISDRYIDDGHKIYYCQGIIPTKRVSSEIKINLPNIPENYIDITLGKENQRNKWLMDNIAIFSKFCTKNNYTPIGVLPWKLYKLSAIPVFNNPDFLTGYKDKIYDFVDIVQNIKNKSVGIAPENITEFYQKELDISFRPKKKINKKVTKKKIYSIKTIDSFNQGVLPDT